jgi:hypothetical protein
MAVEQGQLLLWAHIALLEELAMNTLVMVVVRLAGMYTWVSS